MRRILFAIMVLVFSSQVFAGLELVEDFNEIDPGDSLYYYSWLAWPNYDRASVVSGGIHDYAYDLFQYVDMEPPLIYYVNYEQGNCLQFDNDRVVAEITTEIPPIRSLGSVYLCFKTSQLAYVTIGLGGMGDYNGDDESLIGPEVYIGRGALLSIKGFGSYSLQHDIWYELWIQCDVENKRSRFFIAIAGEEPEVITNYYTQQQWWSWRNLDIEALTNLVLCSGGYIGVGSTQIDQIAVDNSGYCLDSRYIEPGQGYYVMPNPMLAFLTLKANYGMKTGATLDMGDFDGDGDVDIRDFLILRSYYSSS